MPRRPRERDANWKNRDGGEFGALELAVARAGGHGRARWKPRRPSPRSRLVPLMCSARRAISKPTSSGSRASATRRRRWPPPGTLQAATPSKKDHAARALEELEASGRSLTILRPRAPRRSRELQRHPARAGVAVLVPGRSSLARVQGRGRGFRGRAARRRSPAAPSTRGRRRPCACTAATAATPHARRRLGPRRVAAVEPRAAAESHQESVVVGGGCLVVFGCCDLLRLDSRARLRSVPHCLVVARLRRALV